MKTQYCVYFTRLYTRGKLSGLTPKSSLAFPTREGAERWVKNVGINRKLDYVLKDTRIRKIPEIEPINVTWEGRSIVRAATSQSGQERNVRRAAKFTEFTEDKHQARWFRGE